MSDERRSRQQRGRTAVVRRALLAYAALGAAALVLTAFATFLVSREVARTEAERDARRTASNIANYVVRPLLDDWMRGNPQRFHDLDREMKTRMQDGSIQRVKVWTQDGRVLYSDDPALIGKSFPLPRDAARAIFEDQVTTEVSELDEAENLREAGQGRLVEIYVPQELGSGQRLAFEVYFSYEQVQLTTNHLTRQMLPLLVGSLVLLQVLQVPIALSLARRVGRYQVEHEKLLRRALSASERERRRIARDLHDGVVQDLAGVGYGLSAVEGAVAEEQRGVVRTAGSAVRDAIKRLRTAMVDLYPPDLAAGGLAAAIHELAQPLRADGVEVETWLDATGEMDSEVAATSYRVVRESLRNVAEHAQASWVRIELMPEDAQLVLRISDNGVGLPAEGIDKQAEGHLGVRLLADAVSDLGGEFDLSDRPGGGTVVQARLPVDP